MARLTIISAVICVSACLACDVDLKFKCNQNSYLLVNPDPLGCTEVRAYREDRTECRSRKEGMNHEIIAINDCGPTDVIVEIGSDDEELLQCVISCDMGERSQTGYSVPIEFVLQTPSIIRPGSAHYYCHGNKAVFIRNPRPELYTHSVGHTVSGTQSCDVVHTLNNAVIVVSSCNVSDVIIATGSTSQEAIYMIGRKSDLFHISCPPMDETEVSGMEYNCYDDGTVVAKNPNKDLFIYGYSEVNGQKCTVTFFNKNEKIILTDCDIDHYLLLLLSQTPIDETYVLQPQHIFSIQCHLPDNA